MTPPEPRLDLAAGMTRSGMSFYDLWLRQISVGGDAGVVEVEAYVLGLLAVDDHQHDVLAQAINEHFIDEGGDHPVEYSVDRPMW